MTVGATYLTSLMKWIVWRQWQIGESIAYLKGPVIAFQLQLMAAKHACWGNVARFYDFSKARNPNIYIKSSDFWMPWIYLTLFDEHCVNQRKLIYLLHWAHNTCLPALLPKCFISVRVGETRGWCHIRQVLTIISFITSLTSPDAKVFYKQKKQVYSLY